jgi:hypothetical protein
MSDEWEVIEGAPGTVYGLTSPDEPAPLTPFIVASVAIVFVAFCVWLTVRIVNRRERWAKRLGVATLIMALLGYPLSIGPACRLEEFLYDNGCQAAASSMSEVTCRFYDPLLWCRDNGPRFVADAYWWYLGLWVEVNPF